MPGVDLGFEGWEEAAVHIISRSMLREFAAANPEDVSLSAALDKWFYEVRDVRWHHFADVKRTYATASLAGDKVVFNVGGNKCRIITRIMFRAGKVYIRAVLTHAEYDKKRWTGL